MTDDDKVQYSRTEDLRKWDPHGTPRNAPHVWWVAFMDTLDKTKRYAGDKIRANLAEPAIIEDLLYISIAGLATNTKAPPPSFNS